MSEGDERTIPFQVICQAIAVCLYATAFTRNAGVLAELQGKHAEPCIDTRAENALFSADPDDLTA